MSDTKRKTIEDQFQSYVVQMFGPAHPITKDDMNVMRQMFFAGYRVCYHTIQHATALPNDDAVQNIMNAIIEDLVAFFPTSATLVKNPLEVDPNQSGILKGPLGIVGEDGQVKPFDPTRN